MDTKTIKKYICSKDRQEQIDYFNYCQRYKYPLISFERIGENKIEISYDISDIAEGIEQMLQIAATLKDLYKKYLEVIVMDMSFGQYYLDSDFFGAFSVLKGHEVFVANSLFDYILYVLRNK